MLRSCWSPEKGRDVLPQEAVQFDERIRCTRLPMHDWKAAEGMLL